MSMAKQTGRAWTRLDALSRLTQYCPSHHSTSSTQVACVLHHDIPLQRLCLHSNYTLWPLQPSPSSRTHRCRALIVVAHSLSSPPSLRTPPSFPLVSTPLNMSPLCMCNGSIIIYSFSYHASADTMTLVAEGKEQIFTSPNQPHLPTVPPPSFDLPQFSTAFFKPLWNLEKYPSLAFVACVYTVTPTIIRPFSRCLSTSNAVAHRSNCLCILHIKTRILDSYPRAFTLSTLDLRPGCLVFYCIHVAAG